MLSRPTIRRTKAQPGEWFVSTLTQPAPTAEAQTGNHAIVIGILIGRLPIRIDLNPCRINENPISNRLKTAFFGFQGSSGFKHARSTIQLLGCRRRVSGFAALQARINEDSNPHRKKKPPSGTHRSLKSASPRLELTVTPVASAKIRIQIGLKREFCVRRGGQHFSKRITVGARPSARGSWT
jgi:hypothetical protein